MDNLLGTNPHAVLDLLRARRSGVETADSRKLALVVEGGGMRGVLSAGALLAFDLLGFRNCFDVAYATSAGGVNTAFFLSGQGELGITVYFDDISNSKFINLLRPWRILDVEYAYDHVTSVIKPLDDAALRRSRTRFYLSVTHVESGENVLIDASASTEPVNRILKASSALPVFYNRTVQLGSEHYVDGGISDAMPIVQAIERGCTDILVLATKPRGHVSSVPSAFTRGVFYAFMGRRYPKLSGALHRAHERANQNRSIAIGATVHPGVNVATVCPDPHEMIVGKMTTNRARLIEGSYRMAAKTYRLMGEPVEPVNAVFRKFAGTERSMSCRSSGV